MGNCCATTGELQGHDLDHSKPNAAGTEQKGGEDQDMNSAVLKIQASFRGKIARQAVEH